MKRDYSLVAIRHKNKRSRMTKIRKTSSAVLSLSLVVILLAAFTIRLGFAQPRTITVPDDFATIQEAVDAANAGDIIFVRSGIYNETVTIRKDGLVLTGENKDTTVIDGGGGDVPAVLVVSAENIEVNGFNMQNGYEGIELHQVTGITISGNMISTSRFGVGSSRSSEVTLSGNTLTGNEDGIYLWDVSSFSVSGNTITNNTNNGISIIVSSDCNFSGNMITGNANNGVSIGSSSNCTVYGNRFADNKDGIRFYSSEQITVTENTITDNEYGINFWNVSSITVSGNTLSSNEIGFGIYGSTEVSFYHNNLINSTKQIDATNVTNNWDNGAEGNYWSDYDWVDANRDGIGDTQYVIDSNNKDNYPLMTPYYASTSSANKPTEENVPSEATVTDPNLPATELSPKINTDTASKNTTEAKVKKLIMTTDQQEQQERVVIPEFPSCIIISLFLTVSLAVTIYKKKLN